MQPIPLTDVEMIHVYNACRPLALDKHDAFLRDLAKELSRQNVIGPGLVFRAIASIFPKFFDPPDTTGDADGFSFSKSQILLSRWAINPITE